MNFRSEEYRRAVILTNKIIDFNREEGLYGMSL